ncbi:MAG: ATP-binding protein [Bacteroidales bacterium]|nr:ATP-binding protein [Bacteroidales bacterium]
MILKSHIEQVVLNQSKQPSSKKDEILRENIDKIHPLDGFASIITGLRRCGKSTLMRQVAKRYSKKETLFLNFEDINLIGFSADDFKRLYAYINDVGSRVLFFDEIQLVEGWEIFVHQLLREGYMVFVTGSNAAMLSVELGTNLTGRHISTEMFPFSYTEYLTYLKKPASQDTFLQYLTDGGMPEYLASKDKRVLHTMLDDILIRDIAIRHNIRNVDSLRKLAAYLLTNIAKPYTANRLTSVADDIATSSVLEYITYMRDAYLLDTIGQYATNIRTTQRNPKKVYAIDTGISNAVSISQSDDLGRLLENHVFLLLRKRHKDHIFYHQGSGECDFVVTDSHNKPSALYQVCLKLTDENMQREIGGLRKAMNQYNLTAGTIVTLSDEDNLNVPEGTITIVKAYSGSMLSD